MRFFVCALNVYLCKLPVFVKHFAEAEKYLFRPLLRKSEKRDITCDVFAEIKNGFPDGVLVRVGLNLFSTRYTLSVGVEKNGNEKSGTA